MIFLLITCILFNLLEVHLTVNCVIIYVMPDIQETSVIVIAKTVSALDGRRTLLIKTTAFGL